MVLGYKSIHLVAMPPSEGVKTYTTKDFEKLDLHQGAYLVWLLYLGMDIYLMV